jgi:tetratricopeptide (TPR) repeat protein
MKLTLVGTFSLRDGDGRDLTPRGAKARAMLAMLCRTPDRRRSRRWIESRLWSNRGGEQASASLRQVLVEIRKALGPQAGLIRSDREFVAIIGIRTDLDDDPEGCLRALAEGREFLEGLDVGDQAFEDWLREERARLSPQRGEDRPVSRVFQGTMPIRLKFGSMPEGAGGFVALALADAIARLVGEFAEVEIFTDADGARLDLPERGMTLAVEAAQMGDKLHVLAGIASTVTRQVLWTRRTALSLKQVDLINEGEFPQVVFHAAEAAYSATPALSAFENGREWADALTARAVRAMFTFDRDQMRRADRFLTEALAGGPSARAYVWRGHLRQLMAIERTETDTDRLMAEADEFSRKAIELSDNNPLVSALVSQIFGMLRKSGPEANNLARDSATLSPFNAHAQAALAGAWMSEGRHDEAIAAALAGAHLAARSPQSYWWDSLAGLTHLAAGKIDLAIQHYERAHLRAPSFRSPLRHLFALHLASGKPDRANVMLNRLLQVEPDFSFQRLRYDMAYPAATLRKTGVLEVAARHL